MLVNRTAWESWLLLLSLMLFLFVVAAVVYVQHVQRTYNNDDDTGGGRRGQPVLKIFSRRGAGCTTLQHCSILQRAARTRIRMARS